MRNIFPYIAIIGLSFSLFAFHSNPYKNQAVKVIATAEFQQKSRIPISSTIIANFFKNYPDLKEYQSDVTTLYKKRKYNAIWHDDQGIIEFAYLLHPKVNLLEEEGLDANFAYKDLIDGIFNDKPANSLSPSDTEIMLSSMYVFYVHKVYIGIGSQKIKEVGWFIPTKEISYGDLLDSLLANPELLDKNEAEMFSQYYNLRTILKKYRQIEKNGGWDPITPDPSGKELKPFDSTITIGQVRKRLYLEGDLKHDSKSNYYDEELMAGIMNYKKRHGQKLHYIIKPENIDQMNEPIGERIKTIVLNMERCRWIPPELAKAKEYVIINIPSFKLLFKRNGKTVLESNVFVGKIMYETVIFSADMTHIVFSPYWNIPNSIVENELESEIIRDPDYLVKHNMEKYKGGVRQKPGPENSLGLVKFMFPNSNDIYLHDTPAKSLFDLQSRAFSHGCINVRKAKELALLILKDDPHWPIERIEKAMNGEKETTYYLKNKIPVHIGYFTTWVSDSGEISFFPDIYERDQLLARLLFPESE
ncbi:murein L,D-transpeptidase [compost metagenome]